MNIFSLQEIGQGESFDPLTICSDTPFTQAEFYGKWQKKLNKEVRRFIVSNNKKTVAYFQVIEYPLMQSGGYFYIPYGPILENFSEQILIFIKNELKKIAQNKGGIVFIRFDFTPPIHNKEMIKILKKIFIPAPVYTYHSAYFQPRVEWFLDLNKNEEQLLMEMHEKTRYSVRLAARRGIETEIIKSEFYKHFPIFYELLLETAKRNGFNLHNKLYYEEIFSDLKSNNAYIVIAKYKGKILVADLVIRYGKNANYVFGGSSNEYRNLMPTYLAQWTSICHAKESGNSFYNFGGVALGKIYKGWDGLTAFKKKFGGFEVIHSDFFDVAVHPFWYHLYNLRKFIKKLI